MTIPIIPTPGYNLGQGIGSALQNLVEQRRINEDKQRQDALQGLQLWSQLLPGLAKYSPAQTTQIPGEGGNVPYTKPESFDVPSPPPLVQNFLQKLTGQTSMGLSSEQANALRQSSLKASTYGAEAAEPAAKLAETQASTKLAGAQTGLTSAQTVTAGQQGIAATRANAQQPYIDSLAYADKYAASALLGAARALKVPITTANAGQIVSKMWSDLKTTQPNNPLAANVTPEMLSGAVLDEIHNVEKLGIEHLHAMAAWTAAQRANRPEIFWQQLQDNDNNAIRTLTAEQAQIQTQLKANPMATVFMMNPKADLTKAPPDVQRQVGRLRAIDPMIQQYQEHANGLANKIALTTQAGVGDLPTGATASAAPPTAGIPTTGGYSDAQVKSVLSAATSPQTKKSGFLLMVRNGFIPRALARQVAGANKVSVSDAEIDDAAAGRP